MSMSHYTVAFAQNTVHMVDLLDLLGSSTCSATVAFGIMKRDTSEWTCFLTESLCKAHTSPCMLFPHSLALSYTTKAALSLVRRRLQLSVKWKRISSQLWNLTAAIVQVRFRSSTKQQATKFSPSVFFFSHLWLAQLEGGVCHLSSLHCSYSRKIQFLYLWYQIFSMNFLPPCCTSLFFRDVIFWSIFVY